MTAVDPAGSARTGPLAGLTVVELAGIGPAPYGVMLLADLGADVIRVDRPGGHAGNPVPPELDLLNRNRRSIELDLKNAEHRDVVLALVRRADVLVEGFRPGVAERLGLGPAVCLEVNPALVYGRMTGWGQTGPLAGRPGHDINFIAIAGALDPIGTAESGPVVPLNLLGDFGGGGTFLALGVLAAVLHARATGEGQVVDASVLDGTASLTTMLHAHRSAGMWNDARESNLLDGGAHFYRVYETADGRHLSVGAIEPQFYEQFVTLLGEQYAGDWARSHRDPALWPRMTERVAAIVASRTLAEWTAIFDGTDACVQPVLSGQEAVRHPHNVARDTFVQVGGRTQPAPAPRFSVTPAGLPRRQPRPGADTDEILRDLG
ncbi:CaiB/BaiF CoA transferase family protein [Kribbella sp. CA-253562]|uniref:CaiB/BaiF CoA transferase family protein n=1 Tax=Kribbella sp. CA-253562 TaxID=3239942 RepID=UPI003D920EE0